jgi:hypothetical protein
MRTFFLISALCFVLAGCSTTPREMRAVWTQRTPPPIHLPAPAGFTVTPARAYARAYESDMISLKHDWYIYADSRYYYVHDVYLGSSVRRAFNQGVRIDGQTGEIVRR